MLDLHLLSSCILYILPAYVANATACIFGGGKPLDLGKKFFDNKRVLGDGVTIRGSLAGLFFGTLTGIFEGIIFNNILFYLKLSFLLSLGAILGDAVGSFIKRRLNIDRGKPAPLLDQLDFVIGALSLGYVVKPIPIKMILIIIFITIFVHFLANVIAYLLKIKNVWW
ncbi:CDP-2,3-bis-(O-geranylgeranyl)-sn-glycerol synthase [Methanocaldococcus sp.]